MLCLTDRCELKITGVKEVVSFDEGGAQLVTENGELFVDGEGIRISNLDTDSGEVFITGKIDSMSYAETKQSKRSGVFGRLFG
jgi:sporulation protein YabP